MEKSCCVVRMSNARVKLHRNKFNTQHNPSWNTTKSIPQFSFQFKQNLFGIIYFQYYRSVLDAHEHLYVMIWHQKIDTKISFVCLQNAHALKTVSLNVNNTNEWITLSSAIWCRHVSNTRSVYSLQIYTWQYICESYSMRCRNIHSFAACVNASDEQMKIKERCVCRLLNCGD